MTDSPAQVVDGRRSVPLISGPRRCGPASASTPARAPGCMGSAWTQAPRQRRRFHDIDPAWIEAYNERYHRYDPTPALLAAQPGQVPR
ncbi:MAG: hypothetical protein U5K43_13750 [Halofilum sp. (in: g-proteobacteria)]|nr:hypothetical protein [Halofilum sp. (in: g-proteobacteria)]